MKCTLQIFSVVSDFCVNDNREKYKIFVRNWKLNWTEFMNMIKLDLQYEQAHCKKW